MTNRAGRRAGEPDTKGAILAAARRTFGERGFTGATVRAIAREAGVDPALVLHYFGSKARLFAASVELPLRRDDVFDELARIEAEHLGEGIMRLTAEIWSDPTARDAWVGLVRSALTDEQAATMLRDFVTAAIIGPVAQRLDPADARYRVDLVASHLVGIGIVRYALRVEPLASAPLDDVIAHVAPTLQRYLTGDLGP